MATGETKTGDKSESIFTVSCHVSHTPTAQPERTSFGEKGDRNPFLGSNFGQNYKIWSFLRKNETSFLMSSSCRFFGMTSKQQTIMNDDDDDDNDLSTKDDKTTNNNNNSSSRSTYNALSVKALRSHLTLRGYDCSQCLEKSELVDAACRLDATNYDEEAYKLFAQLNLQPTNKRNSPYSNIDPIWKHPGGGTVYVGNYMAASTRRTLQERNICAIVNCQEADSQNYFEQDDEDDNQGPTIEYHRFLVARLATSYQTESSSVLADGFQATFDFIQRHIAKGNSVLIHCLAGAHRAGTAGTAWIMYKTGKNVNEAIGVAKKCRPVINPFGPLVALLHRLDEELEHSTMAEQHMSSTNQMETTTSSSS